MLLLHLFFFSRLAEGRQPWSGNSSLPETECSESESGFWALATPANPGGVVLGGTEEGKVIAWDVRTPTPAWQVALSSMLEHKAICLKFARPTCQHGG